MRRGVVLFITLAILLLLSSVVFLFLQQSGRLKESVRKNIAVVQTNLILNDLSGYLKNQNFTQDDVFYGAGIPVSLELGPVGGTLAIDSARNRININLLLESVMREQSSLDGFLMWLQRRNLKDPGLMLALLLDTLDADLYEREPRSEIRLYRPWFQNGAIPNAAALETILQTYETLSGDANLSAERWEEVFGFEGETFDLNFASRDQLELLYPDLSEGALERLAAHNSRYESAEDLPVAEEEKEAMLQPRMGITPTLESDAIVVRVEYASSQECSGKLSFRMALKRKKIDMLTLSPVVCR